MSMTKRHLLAGLVGICALASCTDDQFYDTGHSAYGKPYGTSPYGPAGTQPAPYGQPSPYGTTNPNPYGPTQPGSPYAPGAQGNNNPYGPAPTPTPTPTPVGPTEYPVAQRTNNPNQVVSPFDPTRVIDIEGYSSGQLVRDPENKKIFRVP